MAFEDFKTKDSIVLVYTGDGKGKTSAGIGLMARALGNDWSVAFIQFIKDWEVSEHKFIAKIQNLFGDKLFFYKGGKGRYFPEDLLPLADIATNMTKRKHHFDEKFLANQGIDF
jgi:ATP:corrinoid adenosyltransferase